MNEGTPSQVINNSLARTPLGTTADGAYWAIRALHPCDDTRGGGAAIPDLSQTESSNLEYRLDSVIAVPSGVDENWDCQLLMPPTGEMPCAYRTKASSSSTWSYWTGLNPTGTNIQPGTITLGNGDATAIPSTWTPPLQVTDPTLFTQTTAYRATYRGTTVTFNSSSLANQGYVTAGQWATIPELEETTLLYPSAVPPTGWDTDAAHVWQAIALRDVPGDPAGIITRCPEAGQWEARKGIYMPMRFPNPAHQYTTPEGALKLTSGSTTTNWGFPVTVYGSGSSGSPYVFRTIAGSDYTVWTMGGKSVNLNLGVAIFSGMDKTASLVVKVRSGLEIVPTTASLAADFIGAAPPKDQVALDMVQSVQAQVPLVYESRFNSLGMIVPPLMAAAKAVIPHVAPWLFGRIAGLINRIKGQGRAPQKMVDLELD